MDFPGVLDAHKHPSLQLEEWEKRGAELVQAKGALDEELQEAQERAEAEGAAQKSYADKVENLSRELEIMKVELTAAKQNVEKAEFDKNKVLSGDGSLLYDTSVIAEVTHQDADGTSMGAASTVYCGSGSKCSHTHKIAGITKRLIEMVGARLSSGRISQG